MQKKLVTQNLTYVHKKAFSRFPQALVQVVGQQAGIYALYKQTHGGNLSLYYVGKSKNLRSRLKSHFKNKHANQWHRFSFFAIKNKNYVDAIESLVLNLYKPKANIQRPGRGTQLQQLKAHIKQIQKQNLSDVFYSPLRSGKKHTRSNYGAKHKSQKSKQKSKTNKKPQKQAIP